MSIMDMFNQIGGLLGSGSGQSTIPTEYYAEGPVAPMAPEMQGPPIPPPPGGVKDEYDMFARFPPDQRQFLKYAALADMVGAMGGKPGTSLKSLMATFDAQSGRGNPADLMAAIPRAEQAQQSPQMAQPVPLLTMPAPQAPQTRSPMAMNLPRPVAIRVPSLLGR